MKKVTLRGTGQLNGPRIINKVLELEDQTARDLMGQNSDSVILALMAVHYPGVKIIPRNIGINVENIQEVKKVKEKTNHNNTRQFNNKTESSSFSFSNILLWILFFPFKLVWWILKNIWKDDHMSNRKWDKFN